MFNFLSFPKSPRALKYLVEVSDSQPKPALEYSEGLMCLYKNQSQLAGFSRIPKTGRSEYRQHKTQPLSKANTPNSTIPAPCLQSQEFTVAKLICQLPKGKKPPRNI